MQACWCTLQAQWLYSDTSVAARVIQDALHSVLVPLSVVITLQQSMPLFIQYRGADATVTMFPHLFAVLLVVAMLSLGSAKRQNGQDESNDFIIRGPAMKLHISMLLLGPPLIFTSAFFRRIVSNASFVDVWLDLVLVWAVPYLLLYVVHMLRWNQVVPNPYRVSLLFGSSASSTLRGALVPMVISVVASLALEYEYLIPLCRTLAYNFRGHNLPDTGLVSAMLTGSVVAALFAGWVAGRKSAVTGEPLFGEYQDDIVQLSLALTGMLVGKAVGMPWSLTPLPILAVLGMVIWLSTRMLRYLAMLLFVVHSTFLVLWSYRYAGIEVKMKVFHGLEMNLFRFGMANVAVSLLVFMVMGLAVRSSGGVGQKLLRRFDVCGVFLLIYSTFETIIECILLKCPLPFKDLVGIEALEHPEEDAFLYKPILAYTSSATIAGICFVLHRYKIISSESAIPILSISIGKAVAIYIDLQLGKDAIINNQEAALSLLMRVLAAALLLFTMMAPRAFLSPVHFKVSGSRMGSSQGITLPTSANRTVIAYGMFILPLTLIASIPWILRPLVGVLSGHFGAYYITNPAASETFGWVCSLWGLALLSAVNHLLPDGGAETWKKAAAISFLMGLGVALTAPTIPPWILRGRHNAAIQLNPFASFSSASPKSVRGCHAGGWGLLAAALATLLAITGPLDLADRTDNGKTDRFLLFRTMIFSILFGCGIAWFISLECMGNEAFLPIFCTATACMAMCFFGTVGGVLSYMLDLNDFEEAEQVLKVWIIAFPIFLATAGLSQLAKNVAHPFGEGGWLSTYLTVCGLITIAICLTLRSRGAKNSKTRGIGNSCCFLSWICWISILYGRYGVAGMDAGFELTTLFGIPASVLGTMVASLNLLWLEHDSSKGSRARGNKRQSAGNDSVTTNWMCINIPSLSDSNRLAPSMTATIVVLVGASVYAILFRGLISAASSQQVVFDSIYGSGTGADDLASLARQNDIVGAAVRTASALSGSSFWTAASIWTPLLYVVGLMATLPSLYGFLLYAWGIPTTAAWVLSIPLNALPLLLCRSLPPLFAASLLGTVGGVYHILAIRGRQQQSHMRI